MDGFLFSFVGSNTNTVTANSALIQTPAYNYVSSNMPALTALTVSILPSFVSPNSGIAYNVTAADRYLTFITAGTETRDGTNIDTSNFSINYGSSFYVAGLSARTDRPEIVDFTPTNVSASGNEEFILTLSGSTYTATGTTVSEVTSRLASAVLANPSLAGTCTDMTTKIQCTSLNGSTSLASSVSVNYLTPDTTPPVVTLVGSGSMDIPFGGVYSELGATWTDNRDQTGVLTGATIGSVNTNMVGLQTLTYRYTDMAGNASNSINRTVTIVDSTPPVVTLVGSGTLTIERASTYTDSGATWTDNAEGSGSLILANASGSVNVNSTGSYLIEYTKTDASGNVSNTVSRIIMVVDTTPPTLTITTLPTTINANALPIRGTTTGDASSVTISGGSGATVIATLTGSGAFSALVPLTPNNTNTLIVTASDVSGNSSTGSVIITTISGSGTSFSGALVMGSGSTLGDVSSASGTGGITSTTLVTVQAPVSFVGSGSGSRVTLPADTTIRTASGTAFNGSSIGAFTGAALTLASNEASNGTFSFGLANTSLHFSKPIKIEIPLSNYTGSSILIKVQHA